MDGTTRGLPVPQAVTSRNDSNPGRAPGPLSLGRCGDTHGVGVEVNEAVGVAHGAGSVLDDPDVGSGQVDVGLQHFHDHLRGRGAVDALEHDG